MKYAVIYESATGNTKQLAEAVREELGVEKCVCFAAVSEVEENMEEKIKEADVIFLGFWTDKGDCSEKIGKYMETLHGRKVFLFGTAGFGGAEAYFAQILSRVSAHLGEGDMIAGSYMCQGRMPEGVRRRYESMLEGVRRRYESMLEKNPGDEKMQAMIENFDRALAHPDEKDTERLRQKVKELNI